MMRVSQQYQRVFVMMMDEQPASSVRNILRQCLSSPHAGDLVLKVCDNEGVRDAVHKRCTAQHVRRVPHMFLADEMQSVLGSVCEATKESRKATKQKLGELYKAQRERHEKEGGGL
mmetsp:Transcript_3052/g.8726  ORF Transcript_3052/g.8726 Transcript_3052/m.8726 type:complete len:116 (-) Transcript_3052:132-479(-)